MNEEALLHTLGITEYHMQGDEYLADCIFCGDEKGNLQVNFQKKLYHCWACGKGGSLTQLIVEIRGVTRKEANEIFDTDIVDINYELDYIEKFFKQVMLHRYKYKQYKSIKARELWRKRNLNIHSINKYNLGFDDYTNRLVIPIFNIDGDCVGLTRRSIDNKQKPKYLHTQGLPKSTLLYGWERINFRKEYITLVEGNIDAIKVNELKRMNAVALMGVNISNIQVDLMTSHFNRVMLMLDNDEAGEKATREIVRRLEHKMEVFRVNYNTDDPGDLSSRKQILSITPYTLA